MVNSIDAEDIGRKKVDNRAAQQRYRWKEKTHKESLEFDIKELEQGKALVEQEELLLRDTKDFLERRLRSAMVKWGQIQIAVRRGDVLRVTELVEDLSNYEFHGLDKSHGGVGGAAQLEWPSPNHTAVMPGSNWKQS